MIAEPQGIAEAVASWLHYKSLTGLSGLLNEASMAVPIAEFLSARYGGEVESERAHPLFKSGGPGRPKQIDFVRVKRGEKSWHSAYECKYGTTNQSQIVEDICRLACLAQVKDVGKPARYFIYAARGGTEESILDKWFNTGGGQRLPFFDLIFKQGNAFLDVLHSFRLSDLHPQQKDIFRSIAEKYKMELPSILVTKLSGWSRAGDYCCAVWKVNAAQGSVLITAEDLKS